MIAEAYRTSSRVPMSRSVEGALGRQQAYRTLWLWGKGESVNYHQNQKDAIGLALGLRVLHRTSCSRPIVRSVEGT